MTLKVNLGKNDFLQYQLYKYSKMKIIKVQRIRNGIIVSGLVFLFGIYIYFQTQNIFCMIFFGILSIIIFLIYPLYLRLLYKRGLSKFIDENYKNKINNTCVLEISNGFILSKDSESETKMEIDIKAINEIVEIQKNYFIIIDDISSIILPKNIETNNFVNILINNNNIKINKELNWNWK